MSESRTEKPDGTSKPREAGRFVPTMIGNGQLSANGTAGRSATIATHAAIMSWCQESHEIAGSIARLFPESACSSRLTAATAIFENSPDNSECKLQLREALQSVMELISPRLQQLERQRPGQTSQLPGRNVGADQIRTMNDSLRRLWDDSFSRLEQELQDRIRGRMLPLSLIANRIQNMTEDLSESSLVAERIGRNLRLQFSPDSRRDTEAMLMRSLEDAVTDDVSWLNGEQSELARESSLVVAMDSASEHEFTLEEFTAAKILDWLKPQLTLNLKYSGEIPHRTFFDRLSHGRRPVFAAMMIISLVGAGLGLGRGIPAAIAPVALVLFLGGIIWTFRSFGEERQWLLERELGRLRETMSNECQRCIEGLLREWSSRAIRLLRDRQKSLQRQSEDWSRGCAASPRKTGDTFQNDSQAQQLKAPELSADEFLQLQFRTEQLLHALIRDGHSA